MLIKDQQFKILKFRVRGFDWSKGNTSDFIANVRSVLTQYCIYDKIYNF